VTPDEIESQFHRAVRLLPDPAHSASEERFKAIAATDAGRMVFVVFTLRRRRDVTLIRPDQPATCTARRSHTMRKKLPKLKSDAAAEAFVADADLTQYDLSGMTSVRFEMKPKDRSINLRLPEQLLTAVQTRAKQAGIPYQRFIRMALEHALQTPKLP
jgi:predicted DNA binding CopG/RHH family protein